MMHPLTPPACSTKVRLGTLTAYLLHPLACVQDVCKELAYIRALFD